MMVKQFLWLLSLILACFVSVAALTCFLTLYYAYLLLLIVSSAILHFCCNLVLFLVLFSFSLCFLCYGISAIHEVSNMSDYRCKKLICSTNPSYCRQLVLHSSNCLHRLTFRFLMLVGFLILVYFPISCLVLMSCGRLSWLPVTF